MGMESDATMVMEVAMSHLWSVVRWRNHMPDFRAARISSVNRSDSDWNVPPGLRVMYGGGTSRVLGRFSGDLGGLAPAGGGGYGRGGGRRESGGRWIALGGMNVREELGVLESKRILKTCWRGGGSALGTYPGLNLSPSELLLSVAAFFRFGSGVKIPASLSRPRFLLISLTAEGPVRNLCTRNHTETSVLTFSGKIASKLARHTWAAVNVSGLDRAVPTP